MLSTKRADSLYMEFPNGGLLSTCNIGVGAIPGDGECITTVKDIK
jgi:hypothetical protein